MIDELADSHEPGCGDALARVLLPVFPHFDVQTHHTLLCYLIKLRRLPLILLLLVAKSFDIECFIQGHGIRFNPLLLRPVGRGHQQLLRPLGFHAWALIKCLLSRVTLHVIIIIF